MIPEIGNVALALALTLALIQGVLPLIGAWRRDAMLMALARPAALGQAAFVTLAFLVLVDAFLRFDFSIAYVVENSNLALPWHYRVAAVWGAHEGSLLLWILILNGWTVALVAFSRRMPPSFASRVLGVLGLVSTGFLSFILFTSNPFLREFPVPADGADLNPVLQDPGMTMHPPVLYMGYVGFSVAFAFSMAALLEGELQQAWVRWARIWTNAAWGFLTAGIVAGSWWAYAELGWGGWWFWDPVENASFMPWLAGVALIHAQSVTEKRGSLRAWTILLSLIAFALSLLGTFLVRSGVLTSVHAFASDPRRGIFILGYLLVVVGGSLLLYALRSKQLDAGKPFAVLSRETAILVANLLFATTAAMVLLGTLFPLIGEALHLGRISVGPPYFGFLFALLMLPVVLLLPFGPFLRWGIADLQAPRQLGRRAGITAMGGAIAAWLVYGGQWRAAMGAFAATWICIGTMLFIVKRWRDLPAGRRYPAELAGMAFAHLGVGIFFAGVILSQALSTERDVLLSPGSTAHVGTFDFRFEGVARATGPNWQGTQGRISVLNAEHRVITTLFPQKRLYLRGQTQTESAIDPGPLRDLYVALGEPADKANAAGPWSLRLYEKPFVRWIWFGGALMMLGGFTTAMDKRLRVASASNPSTTATPAPRGAT